MRDLNAVSGLSRGRDRRRRVVELQDVTRTDAGGYREGGLPIGDGGPGAGGPVIGRSHLPATSLKTDSVIFFNGPTKGSEPAKRGVAFGGSPDSVSGGVGRSERWRASCGRDPRESSNF